ncbi:MAG: AAA family ATPase [Rhodospirillales bacterium]|nr:AAA family ATPase [Rhodospirillales bacterium]
MRLRDLSLHRYGHLSDIVLRFPERAALCVVLGANEAGKSTALAAVGDALYGIHDRSPAAFLHGAQTRVGITLAAQDGTTAGFVRRKGRKNTLLDPAETPLPEAALQRFLGGAGRDTFEGLFGLNGDRLRAGAIDLAQLGGRVGESLFAAGTGLTGLRAALERIDEEAKTLVGDGRGKRRLAQALDAWHAARRMRDEREIRPAAWQEADRARAAAHAEIAAQREDAARLDAETSRLERVRRVLPLLRALDAARTVRDCVAATPRLPEDAAETFRRLTAARAEAARAEARTTDDVARLRADRDALVRAPDLLAAQDLIDALAAPCAVAVQAEADLPAQERVVAAQRSVVAQALRDLGLPLTPEQARDAVPPQPARRLVRRLRGEHDALLQRRDAARQALAAAELRKSQAEAELARLPPAPDPSLLRSSVEQARAAGPLDAALATRERQHAAARAALDTALAALPLWTGDAAALAGCALPLAPAIQETAAALVTAETRAARAAEAIAAQRHTLADIAARLVQVARGETIPTPAVVAAARTEREAAWQVLRAALATGQPADAGAIAAYEQARDAADLLADRRADEAHRVSEHLGLEASRAASSQRLGEAEADGEAAAQALADAQADWRALWAPAGIVPGSPAVMADWLRQRADVLKLAEAARAAQQACEDVGHAREAARALLLPCVPDRPQDGSLATLLLAAEDRCAADERARDQRRAVEAALLRETDALPALRHAVAEADAALVVWGEAWQAAVARIGMPAADPDLAEAALEAWQRIEMSADPWRTAETRVGQMRESLAAFAAATRTALARAARPPADDPPAAIAGRLGRELAAARAAEARATELTKHVAAQEAASRDAAAQREAADAALAALRAQAGVADDVALEAAIADARKRDAAEREIAQRLAELAVAGDGQDEAALRAEADQADPDALAARLQALRAERQACVAALERATEERTRRDAALAAMERGQGAAAAAQDMRHALADAGAAAERYARLHVARTLLQAGIARFRRAQQAPLLGKASAHFAALTGGHYAALITDENERGETVIQAVRDTGHECPLEALSDGTRDQLYLALRVATVEAHCAAAEPLPFVADDLLVHFDDARALAALRLLTTLGRTAQVVLFTHHDHIATLAASLGSPEVAVIRFGEGAVVPAAQAA